MSKPVIRTCDIETFPNIAAVWGFWNNNVGLNQVLEDDSIASFAYKDLGGDCTYYLDRRDTDEEGLTLALRDMYDQTDIIIGHNYKRFDDRWILGRCIKYGLTPPSPYKVIDTLLEAKKVLRVPSYKLEYIAKMLGVAPKSSHAKFPGYELWAECLKDNPEAWDEMEMYNRQDVVTNEEVYLKMRPYMKGHPNLGVYLDKNRPVCPVCGSKHIYYRGYAYTKVAKYHQFQCRDCGHWGRERKNVMDKDKRKKLVTD